MSRWRVHLLTAVESLLALLALLPVVTSTGRGSDVMGPLAIHLLGGMAVELVTLFVVPVLYCAMKERELARSSARAWATLRKGCLDCISCLNVPKKDSATALSQQLPRRLMLATVWCSSSSA